jgi:hypothetical protein
MKNLIYIIALILVTVLIYFGYRYAYSQGYKDASGIVRVDTVRVVVEKTITKIKPVFKYVVKTDTVRLNPDLDSLWYAALEYWQSVDPPDTTDYLYQHNYAAEMDTALNNDELKLNVRFVSPLPLSRYSFFDLSYKLNEKSKTITIVEKKRWGLGLQAGIGLAGSGISAYIGFGLAYNIWSF